MSRWLKALLVVLVVVIALLVLNAVSITNETKDAERTVEGAELIETSNGTLQVLEEGDPQGSPIVLIHCYAGSMNWYEQLAPLLAERHRVIRVDLLGHGGSDKPGAGYEISDQANAIAEALSGLGVSDAAVVGHSLGGSVATALAEQSPELATRVVILDQAANDDLQQLSVADKAAYAPLIGPALNRGAEIVPGSVVRGQYERAFARGFNIASGFEDPDQVVEDLRAMTYTAFDDSAEADSNYTEARPLDERLSAIEVPTLVIFGTEDQVYDAEEAIQPYEGAAGIQTELIEGVGHSPNVESPERTAALIEGFVARSEAAARAARRAEAARQAQKRAARKAARARAQAKQKAEARAEAKADAKTQGPQKQRAQKPPAGQ